MQGKGGKRGANDSTFLDSTMHTDLDQTMNSIEKNIIEIEFETMVPGGPPGSRQQGFDALYTPRASDAGLHPIREAAPSPAANSNNIDFDAWAGEDAETSGLDYQPSDLGSLEKNKLEPRRATLITKQFGEALKSFNRQTIQAKPKEVKKHHQKMINPKEISNIVQSRFFGQKGADAEKNERKISEARTEGMESEDGDSVQPSIQLFIEKFGFVEISEVDQILNAVPVTEYASDAQNMAPTNAEASSGSPSKQSSNQRKRFIEDVKDIPLLEQEIVNQVNMLLDGAALKGTICSFAVSPKSHAVFMFGTETGDILECFNGDKPNVKKHSLDSKVTAIAVSPNDEFFAAGSANSEILIKKTEGKLAKKYLKSLNQQRIQQILFLENSSVLVGTYNCVYHFTINSMAGLLLEINHTDVYKHPSDIVMQITSVFHEGIWKGLIALHDKVIAFGITKGEKKTYKVHRIGNAIENAEFVNADQNNKWPPAVDWINTEPGSDKPLRFVIIWRNYLTIYSLESQKWSLADQGITLNKMTWVNVLDNRILCLANTNLEFEFLTVERLEQTTFIDNGDHARAKIDGGFLKDQRDQNYMTKYKDKLEEADLDISNRKSEESVCGGQWIIAIRRVWKDWSFGKRKRTATRRS